MTTGRPVSIQEVIPPVRLIVEVKPNSFIMLAASVERFPERQ